MNQDVNGWLFVPGALLMILACSTEDCRFIIGLGIAGGILLFFSFRENRNPYRLRRMAREFLGYPRG